MIFRGPGGPQVFVYWKLVRTWPRAKLWLFKPQFLHREQTATVSYAEGHWLVDKAPGNLAQQGLGVVAWMCRSVPSTELRARPVLLGTVFLGQPYHLLSPVHLRVSGAAATQRPA